VDVIERLGRPDRCNRSRGGVVDHGQGFGGAVAVDELADQRPGAGDVGADVLLDDRQAAVDVAGLDPGRAVGQRVADAGVVDGVRAAAEGVVDVFHEEGVAGGALLVDRDQAVLFVVLEDAGVVVGRAIGHDVVERIDVEEVDHPVAVHVRFEEIAAGI